MVLSFGIHSYIAICGAAIHMYGVHFDLVSEVSFIVIYGGSITFAICMSHIWLTHVCMCVCVCACARSLDELQNAPALDGCLCFLSLRIRCVATRVN